MLKNDILLKKISFSLCKIIDNLKKENVRW